ncbi:MAG: tetratricopeptide repeat protein [Caldilineaceae bacterium]
MPTHHDAATTGSTIQTSGGAVTHDVTVSGGGDFVGRDKVTYQLPPAPAVDLSTALAQLAALPTDHVPAPGPLPTGSSLLPFGLNPHFVGRQAELGWLAETFKGGQTAVIGQVATVTGLGGIGKTQLASAFAHHYGQYFLGGVAWINFANAAAISNEVVRACGALPGLPPHWPHFPFSDQVLAIRAAWQAPTPRLLIFDNCEEESLLEEWRPKSGGTRLLVTSRRGAFAPTLGLTPLPLTTLPRLDSLTLLRHFRADLPTDDPDLAALAAEVGDLALALHLAGSYLKRYQHVTTPAAYIAELRSVNPLTHRSLAMTRGHSPTGHDLHVARTFALSYDQLNLTDPIDELAQILLGRTACFSLDDSVPRALLLATLPETVGDPYEREDALARLIDLGLITQGNDAVVLHRLLANFVQGRQVDDSAQIAVELCLMLNTHQMNKSGDPQPVLVWQNHLRHVTNCALPRKDNNAALLASGLGLHLIQAGDWKGAREYYEKAIFIWCDVLKERHRNLAESLSNLGALLLNLGDHLQAQTYLEQALIIKRELLKKNDISIANTLNELGRLAQSLADLTKARTYHEEALAIYRDSLGEQHPWTATNLGNLGLLMKAMGDIQNAQNYLDQALSIHRKTLGNDHPYTASSLNNLGGLLIFKGDPRRAQFYFQQALDIYLRALGERHPYTADTLHNMGGARKELNDLQGAQNYFKEALNIRKQVLGEHHPSTANTLDNLGGLLHELGDFQGAISYYQQALAIYRQILGNYHPITAQSLNNLAILLKDLGNLNEAQAYHEEALAIRENVLGKLHPDTANSLNNLAALLHAKGDRKGAYLYTDQALAIRRNALGEDHPATAYSLYWLGRILVEDGHLAKAKPLLTQALDIFTKRLGSSHPHTKLVYSWLEKLTRKSGGKSNTM